MTDTKFDPNKFKLFVNGREITEFADSSDYARETENQKGSNGNQRIMAPINLVGMIEEEKAILAAEALGETNAELKQRIKSRILKMQKESGNGRHK
jgi:hypothetical protein